MPTYRYYQLTPQGKVSKADWIEAEDLADAQAKIAQLCRNEPYRCEIWDGQTRLADFACQPTGCCKPE